MGNTKEKSINQFKKIEKKPFLDPVLFIDFW